MSLLSQDVPRRAPMATRRPRRRGRRVGWGWMVLSATAIAAYAPAPYLTGPLSGSTGPLAEVYADRPIAIQVAFFVHIVCGGVALLLGPWQFAQRLRDRHPAVHRVMGWTSAIAICLAAAAGLTIAPWNSAGMVGLFGFGGLAVLWAYATVRAVRAARRHDFDTHQAWMIRSFALTYSAVTLRLWLLVLIFVQLPFLTGADAGEFAYHNAYAALPFLAWLPNVVVAEMLIARRGLPGFRLTAAQRP